MNFVEPIKDLEKINSIKDLLYKQSTRNYLLFVLGINTGLRISDLLNLKVKQVRNINHIILNEQKTGKRRKIPISNKLKNYINNYTEHLEEEEYLFKSRIGRNKQLSRVQAYRIINNVCKKFYNQTAIGTHSLRKTFGYHFYQQTKDIALLQNILNHASPNITLRYIGIDQEMIDESLKNFFL